MKRLISVWDVLLVLFGLVLVGYSTEASSPSTKAAATKPAVKVTRVLGTVVDAETGKGIEKFVVEAGSMGAEHTMRHVKHWEASAFMAGKFDFELKHDYLPAAIVCVEAEGYLPFVSEVIGEDETDKRLEVKLRRGKAIEGKVVSAIGEAVKGASVLLATMFEWAVVFDGAYSEKVASKGYPWTRTDDQGHFSLPAREWKVKVVVVCDAGHAVVTGEELGKSGVITLQPWGRIEGVLMEGGKPVVGAKMTLDDDRAYHVGEPDVDYEYYEPVVTDAAGRFMFPRVHSFRTDIYRLKDKGDFSKEASASYGPVEVESGKTVSVRYGDVGRPVIGVVSIPIVGAKYGYAVWGSAMDRVGPPTKLPEGWGSMSQKEKQAWYKQWREENKGKPEFKGGEDCEFAIVPDAAGKFRIPAVPAGLYQVMLRVVEKDAKGEARGEEVAHGTDYVVVNEVSGGWNDEPLNVGELRTEAISVLREGAQAPATEFEKMDGSKGTVADYRGKVVVMDMWATWCGPCKAEMPSVKAIYEKYRGDEGFVMLGLSVDEDKGAWKKYVADEKLEWSQGYLGIWHESKVPDAWGVHGIPALFVIDGNGKVVYKGGPGDEMKGAIEKALKGR